MGESSGLENRGASQPWEFESLSLRYLLGKESGLWEMNLKTTMRSS